MAIEWFRSYHGAPTDAKWIVVARKAGEGVTPGHVVAVWWYLLDFASQNNPRGTVQGFDSEVCAAAYGWPDELVCRIYRALIDKRLIVADTLRKWTERQPKREDASTERTRAYRDRLKAVTHGDAVKRTVTPDKRRVEKSREQIKDAVANATGGEPPQSFQHHANGGGDPPNPTDGPDGATPQMQTMGFLRKYGFRCDKHDGSIAKTLLGKGLTPAAFEPMAAGLRWLCDRGELRGFDPPFEPGDRLTLLAVYSANVPNGRLPMWRRAEQAYYEQQKRTAGPVSLSAIVGAAR